MTRGVRTLGWACRIDASGGLPAKCVSSALRLRGFSNGGVPVARAPRPSLPAATVPHAARAVQSQPAADQWSRTHPVAGLDDTEASVQRKQRAAHSAKGAAHRAAFTCSSAWRLPADRPRCVRQRPRTDPSCIAAAASSSSERLASSLGRLLTSSAACFAPRWRMRSRHASGAAPALAERSARLPLPGRPDDAADAAGEVAGTAPPAEMRVAALLPASACRRSKSSFAISGRMLRCSASLHSCPSLDHSSAWNMARHRVTGSMGRKIGGHNGRSILA